jgi:hypothetical protein
MRCRLTFPPIGRLPSTVSATDSRQFCSRFRRYYAAVRLLTASAAASSPRLPAVAHIRRSGVGEMRSPRFRRVPFIRNGVSDHGRAVAPRMTVRNVLPSTLSTVSASAELSLSRLNIPLHMIAVYASRPPSPATTQHLLQGGSLLPYPGRTFTGWTAPASPGALITDFIENSCRPVFPMSGVLEPRPMSASNADKGPCVAVILRGGVSWVTTREPLEVVIYPDLTSDRVAEQLGGCVDQAALEQDKKHSVGNPGRPMRQRTLPSDRRTSARQ